MQAMQGAAPHPAVDRVFSQTDREKLPAGHNPVLPVRELGDAGVNMRRLR
jgi:hypothetical protein